MKALHYSCQGESHKATNKVCQDYSYSEVNERVTIAIVCDGHGGARYFRSDVGAKYATEITKECVLTFIESIDQGLFRDKAFTQVSALETEIKNDNFAKKTNVDVAMRQLFSSIIYRWQAKILGHAQNNPLTEVERHSLDSRYIEDFETKVSLEKTYGCTLMCYVQTDNYWFAFHLGDGKCIAFNKNGDWSEPIPWDERCFLNKTTSLCDVSALDEFRYCYQGDGEFPVAVFLGSDGIDDSFGETTNMVNFYAQVAKMLANDSIEESMASIESSLPELSAKGSQDDMSIACVYDETLLGDVVKNIISWQQHNVLDSIVALNNRIEILLKKYNQFEGKKSLSRSEQIDLRYTITELKRAYQNKRNQAKKFDRFSLELEGEFKPYSDEVGFGEQLVLIAEQRLAEQVVEETEVAVEQTDYANSEEREASNETEVADDVTLTDEITIKEETNLQHSKEFHNDEMQVDSDETLVVDEQTLHVNEVVKEKDTEIISKPEHIPNNKSIEVETENNEQ